MSKKLSFEEKMIRDLLKRKRAYEQYFKLKPDNTVDNQAQSAYTTIIKTLFELSRKTLPGAKDPEEIRRLSEEILESEFGIRRMGSGQ
jgi:hypothetical protein